MSDHSNLGASGSHRWMNCAGAINMKELAGRDTTSSYAGEGIVAHEILKRCLDKSVAPDLFLDTVLQLEDMAEPVTVDEEMVEAVQVVLDYVQKRLDEGAILLGVEVRFDLSPLNPPGPMFGRADIVLQDPNTPPKRWRDHEGQLQVVMPKPGLLEVIDLKYGVGVVVEVKQNSQFMYYALGAVVELNQIPVNLRSTVIQPRATHRDGIVRSWEYTYPELKDFKEELFARARDTQDPEAPLTVGGWCQFCPALAICPAQMEQAQAVAKVEFTELAEAPEPSQLLPAPTALTLEEMVSVMDVAPVFSSWLKAVTMRLRDMTEAGEETGFKLVPKRGRRLWNDPAEAEFQMEQRLGGNAFAPRKLLSVTQAEKALKALGSMDSGEPITDLWSMISNGTNLVPDSDPRPAVPARLTAEEEFEAVDLPFVDEAGVIRTPDEPEAQPEEVELVAWMVEVPDGETFFVTADNMTQAKEEARVYLGVERLPNHTAITPS